MNRKKKLLIYQSFLLIFGISILIIVFQKRNDLENENIISKSLEKKIDKEMKNLKDRDNKFYNVKYSGLDLQGNRYTIFSKEALNSNTEASLVKMKKVIANFYFKDNTILKITSEEADYNNNTLDIEFKKNVKALYEGSQLYAENAKFQNSQNSLIISDNVRIIAKKGTIFADKLNFDIKNRSLNITSLKERSIKTKIIYK